IQVFAKSQQYIPGQEIILTGTHPFLLIVAQQIINSGGNVKGIIFAQKTFSIFELFSYSYHGLTQLDKTKELLLAYNTVRKAKVPIHFGMVPSSIEGNQHNKIVHFSKVLKNDLIDTSDKTEMNCDILGMCYGFNVSSELARQIGCEIYYSYRQ